MASDRISYNIPRCGNLTANLFDYSRTVFNFLDHFDHITQLKKINQLGTLRDIYQGAHHTRYEYVFLQLALVSELCQNKKSDLGLSAGREFCGKISKLKKHPTTGELLQCLVLLSNMGYQSGTISSSRAWLTFLKENKNACKVFKMGLDAKDRKLLDQYIEDFEYHKFVYLIALFQLQRYKSRDSQIVEFCSKTIRVYLNNSTELNVISWKSIFQTIRQISFITLDSLYAPVPFNLELSSILLNFDELYESLFIKKATYRVTLRSLESVLQNTVYLSSDACLNTALTSVEILKKIKSNSEAINGIRSLHSFISPTQKEIDLSRFKIFWFREKKLIQTYRLKRNKDELPKPIYNQVTWENECRTRIGLTRSLVGLIINGERNTIKLSIGLTSSNLNHCQIATLKAIKECINFRKTFNAKYSSNNDYENNQQMLIFFLKSIFGWSKRFILTNHSENKNAIIIEDGKQKFLNQIDDYSNKSKAKLSKGQLFEILTVRKFIEDHSYSGLTFGFLGQTRMFSKDIGPEEAEFDGIVLKPNENPKNAFVYLIEAKNTNGGAGKAKEQLKNRLSTNLSEHLEFVLQEFGKHACVAQIKMKN